jgi:hypothetical protein
MEGQGAPMMGACRFPMPMVVKGELVGDEMRQLCGRSKESHRSFDGGGIIWVGRDVLCRRFWCRELASG